MSRNQNGVFVIGESFPQRQYPTAGVLHMDRAAREVIFQIPPVIKEKPGTTAPRYKQGR
jgi:hypothetical protein